ncbi:MAG TPA: class I SAM-dependent methyltransferase [Bryobacteraceae bacterium]|nr:class I SAM-dependent methyltransferase [Bryobacteraceae bacterium]
MTTAISEISTHELENKVLGLYKDLPLAGRLYLQIRVRNYPKAMWRHLSDLRGSVISLGAGYALLEAMAALRNPDARITASDVNAERIATARKALAEIPNLSLDVIDLCERFPEGRADAFLLLDVLHHLPPAVQESVLANIARALPSGGSVVIKECGTRPAWKKWVNYLNDAIGAPGQKTHPRGEQEWVSLLESNGLRSSSVRIDAGTPYAHIMVFGRKA